MPDIRLRPARCLGARICDPAFVVVLAEHERGNLEPYGLLRAAQAFEPSVRPSARSSLLTTTSTPAKPARFARANTSWSSRPPITTSITAAFTTRPQPAPARARARRACRRPRPSGRRRGSARARAGCCAPSCTAPVSPTIAVTSSPIAPANPLVCQDPSSWKRVVVAVALELEPLLAGHAARAEDGASDRPLRAVDPEQLAGSRRLHGADAADQRARAVLVVDRRPGAPRRLALGRLVRRSVLAAPGPRRRSSPRASSG